MGGRFAPSFYHQAALSASTISIVIGRMTSVSSERGDAGIVGIALGGSQRVYCEARAERTV
jgi:hypothetical protein